MDHKIYKILFALWSLPTAFLSCGALVWTLEWIEAINDFDKLLSFMVMCIIGFGALIFINIDVILFGKARGK